MALSENALRFMKYAYWGIAVAAHLFLCYILFKLERPMTSVIWFFLGLILIYVFYFVYFPPGDPGTQWPPYIRGCPDYLTMLAPGKCVDYVGLGSRLQKADPTNPPDATDTKFVFDATGTPQQKFTRAQSYGLTWEGLD
jgi:hypothetical protein